MPDLTISYHKWCASNVYWERFVVGSKGNYSVKFALLPDGSHGYSCSCAAFKFHPEKECKHIKAVKDERCAWNFGACCGDSAPSPAGDVCPRCGGPLNTIKVVG